MLFNSFIFIELVFVTFVLYYLPRFSKYQVHILIFASLLFYSYGDPELLTLLICSVAINAITSYYVVYGQPRYRKLTATLGLVSNLSILAFFKYSPLIAHTFFDTKHSIGEFLVSIPLPIGISFYTFQGISLLVDAYKQDDKTNQKLIPPSLEKHAGRILFFHSFFPHLVAGPIVKAHDFLPQIGVKFLKAIDWERCFKNLVLGYFLKIVVADNLKDYTYWISFPHFQAHTTITLVTMLLGYSCQIFADFAGYSLIAIGLARLFGYELINNFNFPYISSSFKEFWKRWHISLSSFLMEYLYFPLGGNRKGPVRTYVNLIITMFLGGLWHGATWSYAVWGTFHGLALAIERYLSDKVHIEPNQFIVNAKRVMVFSFVTLAWLLFKLPDFSHVIAYLQTMYTNFTPAFEPTLCTFLLLYSSPVLVYHLMYLLKGTTLFTIFKKNEYLVYGFLIFLIITNSGSSGAFIYFQF
jgi:alginate O-acetyltransferase complex protein AlgI